MSIIIAGVKIKTLQLQMNPQIDDESKVLIEFEFEVVGESDYNLYNNSLIKGPVKIQIPKRDIDIWGKRKNSSHHYTDRMDENTLVRFNVVYEECLEDDNEWSLQTGSTITNVMNWSRTRALAETLAEKGIISAEDYAVKVKAVMKRDYEEMIKFITEGK